MPRLRLEGCCVLVTGGTSGIGEAIVREFIDEGAAVAFTGRRADRGEALVAELGGTKALYIPCDHCSPDDCAAATKRFFEAVPADGGEAAELCPSPGPAHRLILVNNAGVVPSGGLLDTSEEVWDATMNLNVTAAFRMTKLFLQAWRDSPAPLVTSKSRPPVIVNIASDWGVVGAPQALAYCVSKAALVHFTKCVALEFAASGVRVNALCPGDTQVERWTAGGGYFTGGGAGGPLKQAEIDADGADLPMARVARPVEIARAAVFLASDDSSYVTGTSLIVDGGNTAR